MQKRPIRTSTNTRRSAPARKSTMTMSLFFKNRISTLCARLDTSRLTGNASGTSARQPHGTVARNLALISLSLAIPFATVAQATQTPNLGPTPLLDKVRLATDRFWDVRVAMAEGFVPATPCVSGPSEGAMGVHFVMPSRLGDGVLKADEPEALIYEPQSNGALRLVGIEYIALASSVQGPPNLDGHLLNFVDEPNRFGLPAFYEMHVWAWQDNPKGSFADWNTSVTCDAQRPPA
jgi:hypothetical protein